MDIKVNHLSHTYEVEVLHDVSLSLGSYSAIALIGQSGSGKSTLIRLMSGLEMPTSGTILMDGLETTNPEYKKQIGFVFQSHSLFPHLTLRNNITLVLEKTRGFSQEKAIEAADYYLDLLHLEDQKHKLPKHVSGGQAQRASIARALSVNPNIIFLDEPTSALDPILTHEVLHAIEELKSLGKQFVFVTHEMAFVKAFADYVVFMHDGMVLEQGPPSILDHPKTSELQNFMDKVK